MRRKIKNIIFIDERNIRFLQLEKKSTFFLLSDFSEIPLEEGIVKRGEILRAEAFLKKLSQFKKSLRGKSVHLLFPHSYFSFDKQHYPHSKKKKKHIKKFLYEKRDTIEWAESHAYEYEVFELEKRQMLFLRLLPQEMVRSYEYLFKKLGIRIESMYSDILSFYPFFEKEEKVIQIFVDEQQTHLLEYKNGIFIRDRIFQYSYQMLQERIQSILGITREEAERIVKKYGVLKTHRDKRVLREVEKLMTPLFDFLRKKKVQDNYTFFIHFRMYPIPGFSHRLKLFLKTDVRDFCIFCQLQTSLKKNLLLHKEESYVYEPLIARALNLFSSEK